VARLHTLCLSEDASRAIGKRFRLLKRRRRPPEDEGLCGTCTAQRRSHGRCRSRVSERSEKLASVTSTARQVVLEQRGVRRR